LRSEALRSPVYSNSYEELVDFEGGEAENEWEIMQNGITPLNNPANGKMTQISGF
jgi:hypothetical protein